MFEKQIKVNGAYVKGMIKNGTLITNQLVTLKAGQFITACELEVIITELQLVKEELEQR